MSSQRMRRKPTSPCARCRTRHATTRVATLSVTLSFALVGCDDHGTRRTPTPKPSTSLTFYPTNSVAHTPDEPLESEDASPTHDEPTRVGIPADSAGRLILADGGTPKPVLQPVTLTAHDTLPADRLDAQEVAGVTLTGSWVWEKVPSVAAIPEMNTQAINKLKKKLRPVWNIEIAEAGRMRIVFASPSFTVQQRAELRTRTSIYGHLLLWPDGMTYRPLTPGSLRPLLDERRVDVTPLVQPRVREKVRRGSRFGFPTSTDRLKTPWGTLELEQMRTPNVGVGGQLLCRTLVELVGAKPSVSSCKAQHLPVDAKYRWKTGHGVEFKVETFVIRTDFPPATFLTPPPAAKVRTEGLPPSGSGIFLTRQQLTSFRNKAVKAREPRDDPEARGAPGEGIILHNYTDALRFFLLDGVAVAWVRPHERKYIIGPQQGSYQTQWRSFLGWTIEDPRVVHVPARLTEGQAPDAGVARPSTSGPPH